jgi:hypothetical protein
MSYTLNTTIIGPSRGSSAAILAVARQQGSARLSDLKDYLDTVYEVAPVVGLRAEVVIAQSWHETAEKNSKGVYIPWTSYWWKQRLNPAGIGITGTASQDNASRTWTSGKVAALAHLAHLYLYAEGEDLGPSGWLSPNVDPRWQVAVDAGRAGIAPTLDGLTNTWGMDDRDDGDGLSYSDKLVARLNAMEAAGILATSDGTGGATPPTSPPIEQAYKAYTVPGGKRPLLLPSWIKVSIRPVDLARVRSYQKAAKSMTTIHDTGNPRTNAEAEYQWLAAGRPGGEVGGYEWINDDKGVIITGWFDEVTWAQGTPDGNRLSHAGEMAIGGNVVFTGALEVACAVHGGVLEMDGITDEDADVLHEYWYGKYCAAQILNRGIEPQVHAKVQSYRRAAAAFRAGTPIEVPGTVYAPKSLPMVDGKAWDGKADLTINGVKFEAQKITAKTTGALNQRQWASTESLTTGPMLDAGTSVDLLGWVAGELVDGVSEWWVRADGARLWAGGIDAEPKVDPDYGQEPEAHPGLAVVNGRTYYVLNHEQTSAQGREITIHRDGDLHRWADAASAVTGAVKEGDTVICGWWTRGTELPLELTNYDGATVTVQEPIWYIQGNDLDAGNRFWSGLSTERPD